MSKRKEMRLALVLATTALMLPNAVWASPRLIGEDGAQSTVFAISFGPFGDSPVCDGQLDKKMFSITSFGAAQTFNGRLVANTKVVVTAALLKPCTSGPPPKPDPRK